MPSAPNEAGAPSQDFIRRVARQKFQAGLVFAALPVCVQVTIAVLLSLDSSPFPKADLSFRHPAFWLTQIILVCIGVCGNTIVDYNATPGRSIAASAEIAYIYALFVVILSAVVVSMLNTGLSWIWLAGMGLCGLVNILLAYRVEVELTAGKE